MCSKHQYQDLLPNFKSHKIAQPAITLHYEQPLIVFIGIQFVYCCVPLSRPSRHIDWADVISEDEIASAECNNCSAIVERIVLLSTNFNTSKLHCYIHLVCIQTINGIGHRCLMWEVGS